MSDFILIVSPFRVTDAVAEQYAERYTRAELVRHNLAYARLAMRDATSRGEIAIVPALLYGQIYGGADPDRLALLKLTNEWARRVDSCVSYLDIGEGDEIRLARGNARLINLDQSSRMLFDTRADAREILSRSEFDSPFPYLEESRTADYYERNSGTHRTGVKA